MTEQRDGTGTGVWTHPAAETKQPEQPERCECECGACVWEAGPMAWYWQPQGKTLRRMHEYSHLRIYPNDCGFAHCPGECGCRLSVLDGEPRVGPSQNRLLAALRQALVEFEEYDDVNCLWLMRWGLADTAEQAVALWVELGGETDE